jgi:hypothetical protein
MDFLFLLGNYFLKGLAMIIAGMMDIGLLAGVCGVGVAIADWISEKNEQSE